MKDPNFYATIGKMGGLAGRGSEKKRRSATGAARARWEKQPDRGVTLTIDHGVMWISRSVPGLERKLTTYIRRKVEKRLVPEPYSALYESDGKLWTHSGFFQRTKDFLEAKGIPVAVRWTVPPLQQRMPPDFNAALVGFNYREQRAIRRIIKSPVGCICKVAEDKRNDIMAAIFRAYQAANGVVIVENLERLNTTVALLRHLLNEPIGMLTAKDQDWGRITVMTPAYLNTGIITRQDCGILIFERCPRKEMKRVQDAIYKNFDLAWKLAFLGAEKRDAHLRFLAVSLFGPIVNIGGE